MRYLQLAQLAELLRGLILLFPATMRRFPVAQAHYCRRQFVTVLCLMTSFRMKNRGCIQCGRGGVKGGRGQGGGLSGVLYMTGKALPKL